MSYFLKVTNQTPSKGKYLQIYESFWDKTLKKPRNKSFKKIGYVNDLISDDIPDPIAYWKNEVQKLNDKKTKADTEKSIRLISDSPEKNIGYFILKHIYNTLDPSYYLSILASNNKFEFDISKMIEALVYARCVNPCSEYKTYTDVIPYLYENYDFSINQIYEAIEFLGLNYDKVIEIFNECYKKIIKKRNTSKVYFDCTNFYFEIDQEDFLRRKGPSKGKRSELVMSMELLLDAQQIPLSMHIFSGNESEKPAIKDTIFEMRKRSNITGRTIHVANKGLSNGQNIYNYKLNFDGYIYSHLVKDLSQQEKVRTTNTSSTMNKVTDSSGNTLYEYKEWIDDFTYDYIDETGLKKEFSVKEKRVLTFNEDLQNKQKHEILKLVEKAKSLYTDKASIYDYGECSKYVNLAAINKNGFLFLNEDKIEEDLNLAGYNLLVTSELDMPPTEIYETYHNLIEIDESFKTINSQLDMEPNYYHSSNSIKGHFLICYLSLFLLRINQYIRFNNEISENNLCDFIKNLKVLKQDDAEDVVFNLSGKSDTTTTISQKLEMPFDNFFIYTSSINRMINYSLKK